MSPALRHERDHVTIGIVPDRGKIYGSVEGYPVTVSGRPGGFVVKVEGVAAPPTFYDPGETLYLDDGTHLESITTAELRKRCF